MVSTDHACVYALFCDLYTNLCEWLVYIYLFDKSDNDHLSGSYYYWLLVFSTFWVQDLTSVKHKSTPLASLKLNTDL